jgi:hypothetical protein
MRKHLFSFIAAASLLFAGGQSALADTATLFFDSNNVSGKGTTQLTWSGDLEGFSLTMNTANKTLDSASGIKVSSGTSYTSIKSATGGNMTLTLPDGVSVTEITLYSYVNETNWESKKTTCYWSQINDLTYTKATADTMASFKSGSTPDVINVKFTEPATGTIALVHSGRQICFVAELVYTKAAATAASTPQSSNPVFDFGEKAYTVSLTAKNEGETVKYTLNNGDATTYTNPIVVKNDDVVKYWAEATGLANSEESTLTISGLTAYDTSKPYVAWVYQSGYAGNTKVAYATTTDPLYAALSESYNVVPVVITNTGDAYSTAFPTLESADLVVITEAMTGGVTASNSLSALVGKVPIISMKAFNYTYNSTASKNRWGWGTSYNELYTKTAISPAGGNYELFKGTTVVNGEITLFDNPVFKGPEKNLNHIQGVVLSGTSAPSGTTTLATVGDTISFHSASKYVLLGLSCDDIEHANANAQTIIKNAAALLLAEGNNVTTAAEATKVGSVSFGTVGYATFSAAQATIIPEGVTAYTGELSESGKYLNLNEISGYIPANTGVILAGKDDADLNSTIYTIAAVEDNALSASVEATTVAANSVYTLAYDG